MSDASLSKYYYILGFLTVILFFVIILFSLIDFDPPFLDSVNAFNEYHHKELLPLLGQYNRDIENLKYQVEKSDERTGNLAAHVMTFKAANKKWPDVDDEAMRAIRQADALREQVNALQKNSGITAVELKYESKLKGIKDTIATLKRTAKKENREAELPPAYRMSAKPLSDQLTEMLKKLDDDSIVLQNIMSPQKRKEYEDNRFRMMLYAVP